MFQSVREERWTHGLLLNTSTPHEVGRLFLLYGDMLLVGKNVVHPLFGSVVPPSALGETWSAPS